MHHVYRIWRTVSRYEVEVRLLGEKGGLESLKVLPEIVFDFIHGWTSRGVSSYRSKSGCYKVTKASENHTIWSGRLLPIIIV